MLHIRDLCYWNIIYFCLHKKSFTKSQRERASNNLLLIPPSTKQVHLLPQSQSSFVYVISFIKEQKKKLDMVRQLHYFVKTKTHIHFISSCTIQQFEAMNHSTPQRLSLIKTISAKIKHDILLGNAYSYNQFIVFCLRRVNPFVLY